jgi:hypothetical protein
MCFEVERDVKMKPASVVAFQAKKPLEIVGSYVDGSIQMATMSVGKSICKMVAY